MRNAIVEGVLLVLALLGLGAGFVVFAVTVHAGGDGRVDGVVDAGQAIGSVTAAIYVASPALIVGAIALAGFGIMGAVERGRQTAVQLNEIDRLGRKLGA